MPTEPTVEWRGHAVPFNSIKVYSSPLILADGKHVRLFSQRLQWPRFWRLRPRIYTTVDPACYFVNDEVEALQIERSMPPISYIYNHVPMIFPFMMVHTELYDSLIGTIKKAKAGL